MCGMKTLTCHDIDPSIGCHFVVEGPTDEEVIDKMMKHAQEAHPDKVNAMAHMSEGEIVDSMKTKIKTM